MIPRFLFGFVGINLHLRRLLNTCFTIHRHRLSLLPADSRIFQIMLVVH